MAGTYDKLKIFNQYAHMAYQYSDTTFRQILNEQSGGTITSQVRPKDGNYCIESYWANDADQAELEAPNVQATVSGEEFTQVQRVDIKVGCRMKQYQWQNFATRWAGIPDDQQGALWGRTVAESFNRKKLESVVSALVACFAKGLTATGITTDSEITKLIDDQSGTTTAADDKRLDLSKIIVARGKYGDMFGAIKAVVMHSGAFFGMQGENLRSFQELFLYDGAFVLRSPDGLMFYVTDMPILTYQHGSIPKYRTLLLREMAATIYENGDFRQHIEDSNGKTWIETTAQAQQSFNLGIKGMTWHDITKVHPKIGTTSLRTNTATDIVNGLHSDSGVIDNPNSWSRIGTAESKPLTKKELPGVMLLSQ